MHEHAVVQPKSMDVDGGAAILALWPVAVIALGGLATLAWGVGLLWVLWRLLSSVVA